MLMCRCRCVMIVHGVMLVVATSLLLVVGVVAWLMTTIHCGCGEEVRNSATTTSSLSGWAGYYVTVYLEMNDSTLMSIPVFQSATRRQLRRPTNSHKTPTPTSRGTSSLSRVKTTKRRISWTHKPGKWEMDGRIPILPIRFADSNKPISRRLG